LQVKQKEKRALAEKETGFADQVQRQKLISSLPNTFDIIFLIYQSRQRSVLAKHELVDRIIDRSPKIVDKGKCDLCFAFGLFFLFASTAVCNANPDVVQLLNLQVRLKSN
jgi:hypothetical protein